MEFVESFAKIFPNWINSHYKEWAKVILEISKIAFENQSAGGNRIFSPESAERTLMQPFFNKIIQISSQDPMLIIIDDITASSSLANEVFSELLKNLLEDEEKAQTHLELLVHFSHRIENLDRIFQILFKQISYKPSYNIIPQIQFCLEYSHFSDPMKIACEFVSALYDAIIINHIPLEYLGQYISIPLLCPKFSSLLQDTSISSYH